MKHDIACEGGVVYVNVIPDGQRMAALPCGCADRAIAAAESECNKWREKYERAAEQLRVADFDAIAAARHQGRLEGSEATFKDLLSGTLAYAFITDHQVARAAARIVSEMEDKT